MCFRARVPLGVPLHGGIEAWADRPAAASGVGGGGDGYGLAEGLGRPKEGLGPGDAGVLAEEETTPTSGLCVGVSLKVATTVKDVGTAVS